MLHVAEPVPWRDRRLRISSLTRYENRNVWIVGRVRPFWLRVIQPGFCQWKHESLGCICLGETASIPIVSCQSRCAFFPHIPRASPGLSFSISYTLNACLLAHVNNYFVAKEGTAVTSRHIPFPSRLAYLLICISCRTCPRVDLQTFKACIASEFTSEKDRSNLQFVPGETGTAGPSLRRVPWCEGEAPFDWSYAWHL